GQQTGGVWARGTRGTQAPLLPSVGGVGQQGHLPGPLDGPGQLALVPGAVARNAPRQDLGPLRQVPAQAAGLLVVDVIDLVHAEGANFLLAPAIPSHAFPSRPTGNPLKGNLVLFESVKGRVRRVRPPVPGPVEKADIVR